VKVYWCATCGHGSNFGDWLGPQLLERYGIPVEWADAAEADLVSVGSVLARVPDGWIGTVLGSGFIRPGISRDLSKARVLAVRGALTRDACGLPGSTPLGDLGILVDELANQPLPVSPERRRALLVPHYVDRRMRWRHPLTPRASVTGDLQVLLRAVASTSVVYTSSLHGLIAADVLGVPQILEPAERVRGGLFKFEDYVSAFGETIRPGVERLTDRAAMAARRAELGEILRAFAGEHAGTAAPDLEGTPLPTPARRGGSAGR
jgi:hypothetical protein